MAKQIDQLLQKEVTRKEFLALSGFGLASLFGIGTIVKLLTGHSKTTSSLLKTSSGGYGNNPYGGNRESARS